jgi:hypothetical protein
MAVRVVHGQRLISKHPGIWALESTPTVLFQKMLGKARLGTTGARYSVERWTYPGGDDTAMSLASAVKRWLARRAPKTPAQLDREIAEVVRPR